MIRRNIVKTFIYLFVILSAIFSASSLINSDTGLTINVSAEISTTCIDPLTGKIKDWVDCLSPANDCSAGGINPSCTPTGQTDNQTLEEIRNSAFFVSWYDNYYKKQLLNVSTLERRNEAFNKTVMRMLGDIGFILGSLYALTTIYQIIRATLDYVSAGNDEAKFKGAKKRVESLIWAFVYVVLAISIASILFSLMGFGNLFEIEILRNRPVDDTLIN